jgi:hypothetical protein
MHPVYILLLAFENINNVNGQVKGGTSKSYLNLNLEYSETMLLELDCETPWHAQRDQCLYLRTRVRAQHIG